MSTIIMLLLGICLAGMCVVLVVKAFWYKDELKSMQVEFWQAVLTAFALVVITIKQLLIEIPSGEGSVFLGVAAPATAVLAVTAAVKLHKEINKYKEGRY